MSQGAVNFKVFLKDEGSTEARRFTIEDASAITNFLFIKEKLILIFPTLRNATFKITWIDSDNDEITIVCDEDLITAFTEMQSNMKVLYITILDSPSRADEDGKFERMRVVCDVCEKEISGFRYKCMQCPDYDLCSECERKGQHYQHIMMRLFNMEVPRCMPKIMGFLGRSIRNASATATKEAYRMAKHCAKAAQFGGGGHTGHTGHTGHSGHTGHHHKGFKHDHKKMAKYECPGVDGMLFDFASPFMEAINKAHKSVSTASTAPAANTTAPNEPASTSTNNNTIPHPVIIGDIVRNVVNSIFGESNQSEAKETPKPNTPTVDNNKATETVKTPENTAPTTPMEVDQQKNQQPIYPTIPDKETAPDAGWYLIPPPTQQSQAPARSPSTSTPPREVMEEDPKIVNGLSQLLEMGFSNELNLVPLLKRFDGNVGYVVKYLFENKYV